MGQDVDNRRLTEIAAINGFALGGGLELALCCQFRIMADAPKVMLGLTELNLGIIPGWGGTQRLPLVVGKAKALDMMLFSKKIGAQEALEIGLLFVLLGDRIQVIMLLILADKAIFRQGQAGHSSDQVGSWS